MAKAFGIVTASAGQVYVQGLNDHRPIGAFSFLGRYRAIDFPISNMSNSGIDRIQVYIDRRPRSLTEHLGSGRHYNINSKRGKIQLLYPDTSYVNAIYNTDIAAFHENLDSISRMHEEYVVIAPSYMIYTYDYEELLNRHIESGADVTLLYHRVDSAKTSFLSNLVLNLNRQKGVQSIERNPGTKKDQNVFMDTYVMKRELFVELIEKAKKISSMYTLAQILNAENEELDIRGVAHKGYFAALTEFNSYYRSNLDMLDPEARKGLFKADWPIYTRTTDACPTQFYETSSVKNALVANGCTIEGTVENSVIGRGVKIRKGAVVRNCVVLAYVEIGENVLVENQVIDKWAKVIHGNKIVADPEHPGYINRDDTL